MTPRSAKTIPVLLLLAANAVLSAQVKNGLIASFYFSGNCSDPRSGIRGIPRGATLTHDRFGNPNAAFCFDGNDDYITLGTNRDLRQQSMTISLWAKINDFNSSRKDYPGVPLITTRATDKEQFYEAYDVGITLGSYKFVGAAHSAIQEEIAVISSAGAFKDKWQHVVYMFDNDTIYLYVDGKFQQKNLKGFVTSYLLTDSVVLGRVSNNSPASPMYNFAFLNGCIDDVKFYNRILSSSEVLALHREPDPHQAGADEPAESTGMSGLWDKFWYVPVILLSAVTLLVALIRARMQTVRKRVFEKKELEQQLLQSEMKALRSQMNPHFIFNAINSIQHYVLTNEKDLANKYLVKFSKLMRNILDLSKEELISLKEELDTVTLYLEIEALRFNNAFTFEINCSRSVEKEEVRLPPLLIQPFVENAIWHGLLLKEGRKLLMIDISKNHAGIVIKIDDNGIGRRNAMKFRNTEFNRKSLGMEITHSRLDVVRKVHGIAITYEVIDKVSPNDEPEGTTVIIKLHSQKDA